MAANPSAARRTPTTTCALEGRKTASRSRWSPGSSGGVAAAGRGSASGVTGSSPGGPARRGGASWWTLSGMEHVPPDLRHVGEDADAEDDDHAGRQLASDAELVAEVDDRRRDHDVADERDDEDLVVEDALEIGAERPEDGVEGRHDRDREVGVEAGRHVRGEDQPEDDADEESDGGDHDVLSPCVAVSRFLVRASRTDRSCGGRPAGRVRLPAV